MESIMMGGTITFELICLQYLQRHNQPSSRIISTESFLPHTLLPVIESTLLLQLFAPQCSTWTLFMWSQIPQGILIKSQYVECNKHIINSVNFNCVDCGLFLSPLYSVWLIKWFTLNNEASIFNRNEQRSPRRKNKSQSVVKVPCISLAPHCFSSCSYSKIKIKYSLDCE